MELMMTKKREFEHFKLDEEVKSISGHMSFQKEKKIQFNGREILYYTGYSVTDSSCCGMGACIFSYVPGFITKWHIRANNGENPVSMVEPLSNEKDRKAVTKIIMENETCTQVNFMDE